MGYTIFTASGTFTPSNFGLTAGTALFIKVVGGGGGGGRYGNEYGSNGSASSFGSIATAAGSGANNGQNGSKTRGMKLNTSSSPYWATGQVASIGGNGGMGWAPGVLRDERPMPLLIAYQMYNGLKSAYTNLGGNDTGICNFLYNTSTESLSEYYTITGNYTALSNNMYYAGCGGAYLNSSPGSFAISGIPGIGYGGGGSGAAYASENGGHGGHGGAITNTTYVLPNTNAITVTVGAGGAGNTNSPYGGGGNAGCVAIWW